MDFWKLLFGIAALLNIFAHLAKFDAWYRTKRGKPNEGENMIPNTGQTAPASGWRAWLPGITTFSTVVFMISGYFWLSASNRRCFVADQQISSLTNRFSRLEQDWENANLLSRGRITTTVLTCVPMAMPSNGAPLVVFTLKMINSGWPNSATDWKLRTRLPGGQILESLAGIAAGQASVGGIGFGQQFSYAVWNRFKYAS